MSGYFPRRCVVDDGWPLRRATERFQVSPTSTKRRRWGPARIAGRLGLAASTCHAVLRRARVARLADLDPATGRPVRRYEHVAPGDLIHDDVKKLGNLPDGGGWRTRGCQR